MRRALLSAIVISLSLALPACGGSGSDGQMRVFSVGAPTGVPATITTVAAITGRRLDEHANLRMRVEGIGDFICTPTSSTTATVTIGGNTIPPGTYDVTLFTPQRFSPPLVDGLTVNAPPALSSCVPNTFDANFNSAFTLTGTGFIAPMTARFMDGGGMQVGPDIAMTIQPGGLVATGVSPVLPTFVGPMAGSVMITNGDGQPPASGMPITVSCAECEVRSIDGTGNNTANTTWGSTNIHLRRHVPSVYADGFSAPSGGSRPNARQVSKIVCPQASTPANSVGATDMFWLWGQFIDHDMDLTQGADPAEAFDIQVFVPDPLFDPGNTGTVVIPLSRSLYDVATGTSNPRQQLNEITSFIDGSAIYGSNPTRQAALRSNDGTGRMRMSAGQLLPFNTGGLPNADNGSPNPETFYLSGDVRANEQVGLTCMHTLFNREHNRLADLIRAQNPHLTGDQVYEAARRWVGALMQAITFREFLPTMLGNGALSAYAGYQSGVQPDIANVFSTASYRFGHSLVSSMIRRLDANLLTIPEGDLQLRNAFFSPSHITPALGIEPVLRGFVINPAQELDVMIVDDLRNFLFGPPGAGGFDLAALNIQRGRDHGLADYNTIRAGFGLTTKANFAAVTSNATTQSNLASAYPGGIGTLDAWIGGLAEDKLPGALVGELLFTVFKNQFERLRDGDRFWYERVFSGEALATLEATTLADVIRRNTTIGTEIPNNVFVVPVP